MGHPGLGSGWEHGHEGGNQPVDGEGPECGAAVLGDDGGEAEGGEADGGAGGHCDEDECERERHGPVSGDVLGVVRCGGQTSSD